MDEKKKASDTRKPEIERENTTEVEHSTPHPQEKSLRDVNFAPSENTYISGRNQPND
ncbi:hypothetical protein [Virgibacillus sp. DJP39]|uniref:hypothetical protein n=1 Tax=Virgibacillus sp. DJP39 TaxID=3409790 RepID=UPI003BB73D07